MAREALLSLNEFNMPKEITDLDVINLKLIRLILFEPGTSQDQPEKGVGLVSKYRYLRSDDLLDLEMKIKDQINTYIPNLSNVKVTLSMKDHILDIAVVADDVLYEWSYNGKVLNNIGLDDLNE